MAFEGWEKDEQGNIKINPFTGIDTFVPFEKMCGARIAYVTSPAMMASGERLHLPLIMTPAQARELASVLTKLADSAERAAPPERTLQ